jgi:hypothetical protein
MEIPGCCCCYQPVAFVVARRRVLPNNEILLGHGGLTGLYLSDEINLLAVKSGQNSHFKSLLVGRLEATVLLKANISEMRADIFSSDT